MSQGTRPGAAVLLAMLLLASALGACSGGQDERLATYPPDFFSGDRACGGIGLAALRVSIPRSGPVTGQSEPVNPGKPPARLIWPEGFSLRESASAREIRGTADVVIMDGAVLRDAGACVGSDDNALYIMDVGRVENP